MDTKLESPSLKAKNLQVFKKKNLQIFLGLFLNNIKHLTQTQN
jgi:hypothetical protein